MEIRFNRDRKSKSINEQEVHQLRSEEIVMTPELSIKLPVNPANEGSFDMVDGGMDEWDKLSDDKLYFRHTLEAMNQIVLEDLNLEPIGRKED